MSTTNSANTETKTATIINQEENDFREEVLHDYYVACISREVSVLGRKEVLTGKAKFGIFGDGKEVPQIAMSRAFKPGDWRSGYYRDQTFVIRSGQGTATDCFAQLYADAKNDPWTLGRQMTGHFGTATIDQDGNWLEHKSLKNISCDISCTAGQMARAVGLALASKKYRKIEDLKNTPFSTEGNEVVWATIGDASTSEGVFWESINAAGVMKIPLVVSVWDDGYGISVPKEYQTTKGSISEVLEGFRLNDEGHGMHIINVKAWDYVALCKAYEEAGAMARENHIPVLIHVEECTQQLGHSTSGSHERYKSKERLEWEREMDCNLQMKKWMIATGIASEKEISEIEKKAVADVKEARNTAWANMSDPVKAKHKNLKRLSKTISEAVQTDEVKEINEEIQNLRTPENYEVIKLARQLKYAVMGYEQEAITTLRDFVSSEMREGKQAYEPNLYSESSNSALRVPVVPAEIDDNSKTLNGYQILNKFFDAKFDSDPTLCAFGEDVGNIGDVNQGFAGLQEKYGEERIFDCGIREWTIMGQAIGMAMRGLRPIAEIQYLDYLLYGLEPLSDDLATLRWRSGNQQMAPAIIRTRGHRLEGIWHAGSPLGMIINSLRGMYVCVPRNMTQAAGMYNTLLQSDDPALVIECLNGYRLKEQLPNNLADFTVPLGVPEVLQQGNDVTLVTYGTCVRVAQNGVELLEKKGISVELIDAQTLLPFDLEGVIVESLKKTNRVVFMDEDVPGGATAYMMQEVLERQNGYRYLDSAPTTITAAPHRPPYGSDGDYFSKPHPEDVFETVYEMMAEADPLRFA